MNAPNPARPPATPSQIEVSLNNTTPMPTKKGLLGSIKEYKIDITIKDNTTGAVTVLSIMDKSERKVQILATVMFEKLQAQAASTNKIDIKKIKQNIESDENLPPQIAAEMKKMIKNFLKERSASVDMLNKYSGSTRAFWFSNPTNLEKAAFTHSPVELSEADFDVRHFINEIDVLKKSERYDPKNDKEVKAWAQFYAKIRVAAHDSNRDKVDDLLEDEDIQHMLDKGIRLFKNFNYLRAENEVDPRLKDMVDDFENLLHRLPQGLTDSLTAYQVRQKTVQDITQDWMNAYQAQIQAQTQVNDAPDQASRDIASNELNAARRRFDELAASLETAQRDLKRADLERAQQKRAYTAAKLREADDVYRASQEEVEVAMEALNGDPQDRREEYQQQYRAALAKSDLANERVRIASEKERAASLVVAEKERILRGEPAAIPEDDEEAPFEPPAARMSVDDD